MSASCLEARYKQLESNFKAIVAELKARPSSQRQSIELEAILSKLDLDVRHAVLRAGAANLAAHQRLEERTNILQKNFARVVDMLNTPKARAPSPLTPLTLAARIGFETGPATSSDCVTRSPLASTAHHPWSGGAYSAPVVRPAAAATDQERRLTVSPCGRDGNLCAVSCSSCMRNIGTDARGGNDPIGCHPSRTLEVTGAPTAEPSAAAAGAAGSSAAAAAVVQIENLTKTCAAAEAGLAEQTRRLVAADDRAETATRRFDERMSRWEFRQGELEEALAAERRRYAVVKVAMAEELAAREREVNEFSARLQSSEGAAVRLLELGKRVVELQAETESLRAAERYANLQARMQAKRAEENAREAEILQARLGSLALPSHGCGAGSSSSLSEPPPFIGASALSTASNGSPTPTGRSAGGSVVPSLPGEEAGASTELSTTLVEDPASTSVARAPQPAAAAGAAATSAAAPSSVAAIGGVATTGAAVGSDGSVLDGGVDGGVVSDAGEAADDLSSMTTPLPGASPTPTAAAPPPSGGLTPIPSPTAGSALSDATRSVLRGTDRDNERLARRALLGTQTRALLTSQVREGALHIALGARAPSFGSCGHSNATYHDEDTNQVIRREQGDIEARAIGRGTANKSQCELREVLEGVHGECDATATELDARQGDLQLVRRSLHAANQELAAYRVRTGTIRTLLGQSVRQQCRAQIDHARAIAAGPLQPLSEARMPTAESPPMQSKLRGEGIVVVPNAPLDGSGTCAGGQGRDSNGEAGGAAGGGSGSGTGSGARGNRVQSSGAVVALSNSRRGEALDFPVGTPADDHNDCSRGEGAGLGAFVVTTFELVDARSAVAAIVTDRTGSVVGGDASSDATAASRGCGVSTLPLTQSNVQAEIPPLAMGDVTDGPDRASDEFEVGSPWSW